jgi:hypothetical protein
LGGQGRLVASYTTNVARKDAHALQKDL